MQLILEYPLWFIFFCLALGVLATFALYYKDTSFSDTSKQGKAVTLGMAFLRFFSISIISFLLLSPFIKSDFIDKIEPVVVFLHDNTESMKIGFSEEDSIKYINSINTTLEKIEEKYPIDYYTFNNQLVSGDTINFKGKKTNLSQVLNQLNGLYYNRNVGAVILSSDGIFNEGINPNYVDFSFPIYSIAMGDTSIQKDLKISAIKNNKIAYLGDKVEVEIDVESYSLMNNNYELTVSKINDGKPTVISKQKLNIKDNYTEQTVKATIDANKIGIQRYRVSVSEIEGELTYENNTQNFYLDVIDSRQKILLLANAPHPDIAALKNVVDLNNNFQLDIQYIDKFNATLEDYNLVILHQLPSINYRASSIINQIKSQKIPTWFITGASTQYGYFNQDQQVVTILPSGNNTNDVSPAYNNSFNGFSLSENTISRIKGFPPIITPFGDYKLGAASTNLFNQKIGSVETDFPLLTFNENFGIKSAVFVGDGLWRWRLYDFLENNNHETFNEIIQKTINLLSLKADKRKFRVELEKNVFYENEPIEIRAELYNPSYELINDPDVDLLLINEKDEEFPISLNKTNNAYSVTTNSLPVGNYNYVANTTYAGKKYIAEGAFTINELQLEALQTQANHQLLYQLSEKTNGNLFYPDNLDKLRDEILNKEAIKPILYESSKTLSIINLFWIFFLIILLLSAEWFIRKWQGGY